MPPLVVDSLEALKQLAGREIGVSDWLTITQDRIDQFAEATEDRQWIHTNPVRARKESPYGETIAHGFLTLSLVSHLVKQTIEFRGGARMGINYGLNRVRFPAAVRAGTRIRGRVTLESVKEIGEAVKAQFSITVEVEGSEKPCCVAEWLVIYYP
jgi:acyl dehydratase